MLNKSKLLILTIFTTFSVFSACKFTLPTQSDSPNAGETNMVRAIWDPYVGVHPFGCDQNIQQPHLLKLIETGALRGVRLGNLDNPEVQRFAKWFQGHGVEVLGTFDNRYLRDPGICQNFSQHVAQNPGINVWEIGNEVSGFIGMQPEEYMKIFKNLYYYVRQNHPNVVIAAQAPGGNGAGADEFRRMIDNGLDKLCEQGLQLVVIHFYSWKSTRLSEFKSQISRLPSYVRIWITETNDMPPSWGKQIGYVKEIYPKLRSSLRAERIYWYVFSEPSDFSLVKGLADSSPVIYSPLMNALIGTNEIDSSVPAITDDSNFPEMLPGTPPELPPGTNPNNPSRKNPRDRKK